MSSKLLIHDNGVEAGVLYEEDGKSHNSLIGSDSDFYRYLK